MGATVLVCEDRPALRDLYRSMLEGGEFTIFEAHDGIESLRLAQEIRPDIVLLDMVLPGMSGLDVLTEIRSDRSLAGTRVILSTAHRIDEREAEEIGADRVLLKPFPGHELIAAAQDLLARPR